MLETIAPQLPTLAASPPEGDAWLHEIKFDGYRLMAYLTAGRVRLVTRNGHDWSARFPHVTAALGAVPNGTVLDGELTWMDPAGVSDFTGLQARLGKGKSHRLTFQVFDLLQLQGLDLRHKGTLRRKEHLAALFAGSDLPKTIRYVDHIQGNGGAFFNEACAAGLEGIVSKRINAPYGSGRTADWVKAKCMKRGRFAIVGYTCTTQGALRLLHLASTTADGRLTYAGRLHVTGLRRARGLLPQLRSLRIPAPAVDVDRAVVATWVMPMLKVEVGYLERTPYGFRHAQLLKGIGPDDV